ncbi:universal stress protein [Halosegnis marinus]|uniref:Universal stress protein n=1 Tax=Halosegnis marinus TaxID=3034023 RepID=A0ABD5ZK74_9EURY|nr:universal stress protein [Halosegnis sp. DT85]
MTTVLVPYDDSPMAERAFERALADYPDADVHLLRVIDFAEASYGVPIEGGTAGYLDSWERSVREDAEASFEAARETAAERDFAGEIHSHVETGPPARTVVRFAEEHGADYVVMGSHGRSGASRILLGSVAEGVVRRAPCPVLVVR